MESKTRTTQGRKKGAVKKTAVKPTKKTAPAMPPPDEISVSVPMPTALFPGLKKPIILQAFGDGMKNAGICDGDYLVFETDIRAKDEDVVVAMIDGRKVCRRVFFLNGRVIVKREDGKTPLFYAQTCEIYGVLKYVIHKAA